jgi:hypothetical protein
MSGNFQIFGKRFIVSRATKELVSIELNYYLHQEFCCNILLGNKGVQTQGQGESSVKHTMSNSQIPEQ